MLNSQKQNFIESTPSKSSAVLDDHWHPPSNDFDDGKLTVEPFIIGSFEDHFFNQSSSLGSTVEVCNTSSAQNSVIGNNLICDDSQHNNGYILSGGCKNMKYVSSKINSNGIKLSLPKDQEVVHLNSACANINHTGSDFSKQFVGTKQNGCVPNKPKVVVQFVPKFNVEEYMPHISTIDDSILDSSINKLPNDSSNGTDVALCCGKQLHDGKHKYPSTLSNNRTHFNDRTCDVQQQLLNTPNKNTKYVKRSISQEQDSYLKAKKYKSSQDDETMRMELLAMPVLNEEEIRMIKLNMLKGPQPVVVLEKLTSDFVERHTKPVKKKALKSSKLNGADYFCYTEVKKMSYKNYVKPDYILEGSGTPLKHFPYVVRQVKIAQPKIVRLLHRIMYGISMPLKVSMWNILEFSGFSPSQKKFARQRRKYLELLHLYQLKDIAIIFHLPFENSDKTTLIQDIHDFLCSPPIKSPNEKSPVKHNIRHSTEEVVPVKIEHFSIPVKRSFQCSTEKVARVKRDFSTVDHGSENDSVNTVSKKLKDFDNISVNIECSTPEDLAELNDLLFIKPCDSTEIHQRILDFSLFTFSENSIEYYYRKTLLYYMNFNIVQKISELLDIPNCNKITNKEELSAAILKFLVDTRPLNNSTSSNKENKSSRVDTKSNVNNAQKACQKASIDCQEESCDSPLSFISDHMYCAATLQSQDANENISEEKKKETIDENQNSEAEDDIKKSADSPSVTTTKLTSYAGHPTNKELKKIIQEIIKHDVAELSMNGLIKTVYEKFPQFDLKYRAKFIKSKARKILSNLHEL